MDLEERCDSSISDASDSTTMNFNISTVGNMSQDSSSESNVNTTELGDAYHTIEPDKRRKTLMSKRKRNEIRKSATSTIMNTMQNIENNTTAEDAHPLMVDKKMQNMKRKQNPINSTVSTKKIKKPTTIRNADPPAERPTINIPALIRSKEKTSPVKKTSNAVKNVQRVRQVRKRVPLLNEAQVIRAVRAALNEQPIIILPIFLNQDQQE